jgi:hypothetical protein
MVAELCRFWHTDPLLLRRLISLSSLDPEADQVIAEREQWRFDQVAAVVHRLADAGRLRARFDEHQAAVAIGTMTGFPFCDQLATRLGRELAELGDVLLVLLGGVVRLD